LRKVLTGNDFQALEGVPDACQNRFPVRKKDFPARKNGSSVRGNDPALRRGDSGVPQINSTVRRDDPAVRGTGADARRKEVAAPRNGSAVRENRAAVPGRHFEERAGELAARWRCVSALRGGVVALTACMYQPKLIILVAVSTGPPVEAQEVS